MISLLEISLEKLANLSKMTLADLSRPEILGRFQELAAQADKYAYLNEANQLLLLLVSLLEKHKALAQSDQQLFKDYQRLIIYLKFLTLISRPANEIEELFKKHLLLAIRQEISLKDRLRLLFLLNTDERVGDKLRISLIKAMEANEEKIGKENLAGLADNVLALPYVKNWLRNYNSLFPIDKQVRGEFEQATYLNQNKNVGKLKAREKDILAGVIKLYDYLRYPEEAKSEVKATGHILTRPITSSPAVAATNQAVETEAMKKLEELRSLSNQYPPSSLEKKVIEEEIRKREEK